MIYFGNTATATNPATAQYLAKGISDITSARMSDNNVLAKPTEVQPFFSAYAKSIEAFVHATAVKRKVTVSGDSAYPIPKDYVPKSPLPIPPIVCKLAGKQPKTVHADFKKKLEKQGIEEVVTGRGEPTYVIKRPKFSVIFQLLSPLCAPQTARNNFHVQVNTIKMIAPVYQFIDLFLATNTYPYKHSDLELGEKLTTRAIDGPVEIRGDIYNYRPGFGGEKTKLHKRAQEGFSRPRKIDDEEEDDLTPFLDGVVRQGGSVFVAKPSPYPSSVNYGLPSAVPNKGGLIFPYFDGMLQTDTHHFRDLIGRHVFRNLGSDPYNAYKELRPELSDYMSTIEANRIHHILQGIHMALESQTQLFLLFDEAIYLGFVLLGDYFKVFIRGQWNAPLSAIALRAELAQIKSLDANLEDLVQALSVAETSGEDTLVITKEEINTPVKLAKILAQLKVEIDDDSGDDFKEKLSAVVDIVKRLSFRTAFLAINVKNILHLLGGLASGDIHDSTPIFITTKAINWPLLSSNFNLMLAAFGPTGPSFRGAKGEEILVKGVAAPGDPFLAEKDKKLVLDTILVYEKPWDVACRDLATYQKSGRIRFDLKERAAGVRANAFRAKEKDAIIGKMRWLRAEQHVGVGIVEEEPRVRASAPVEITEGTAVSLMAAYVDEDD